MSPLTGFLYACTAMDLDDEGRQRLRRAADRGHANHGWLDTYHTFSFSTYYDPRHMHFRSLRVMNEDWVAPGQGFGTHPHDDMEIVTFYYGETVDQEQAETLTEALAERYNDLEIEVVQGGQPHYHYIISVE